MGKRTAPRKGHSKAKAKQKAQKPCGPSRGMQLLKQWQDAMQQQDAAALIGVSAVSYNRFVRGKRRPSGKMAVTIGKLTDGRVPAETWYEPPIDEGHKSNASKAG